MTDSSGYAIIFTHENIISYNYQRLLTEDSLYIATLRPRKQRQLIGIIYNCTGKLTYTVRLVLFHFIKYHIDATGIFNDLLSVSFSKAYQVFADYS